MSLFTCLICNDTVSELNDYYRELDCSFPRCPGQGYHEECTQRHLRKRGHGSEQKTGYPCPAVLDNGGPCPGTIKKTHIKTPINLKKKELSRQAAVTVNTMANTEHAKVKQSRGSSKKIEATNQVAKASASKASASKASAEKVASAALMAAPNGMRQNVIPNKLHPEDFVAPGPQRTMADFIPDTMQRLNTKANNATTSSGFAAVAAPWTPSSSKTTLAPNPDRARMTSAVSKNVATTPEPVVRQRVVPGWSDVIKPSKLSTLEEQRAIATALRAQLEGGTGRGSKAAVAAAAAAPSNRSAAGGAASKADAGPGSDGRIRTSTNGDSCDQLSTQGDSPDSRFSVGTRGWMDGSAGGDSFSLPQEDFPALGCITADALFSSAGVEAAPKSPMSVLMEPLDTTDDSLLSAPVSPPPDTSFDDSDVDYVQLYENAEGLMGVHNADGNFVPIENIYGSDPKTAWVQDAYGQLRYCVIVPKTHAMEQAETATGYGSSDGAPSTKITSPDPAAAMAVGGMGCDAFRAEELKSMGWQVGNGAVAPGHGGAVVEEPLAAAEDVEAEISMSELMALCLGQA